MANRPAPGAAIIACVRLLNPAKGAIIRPPSDGFGYVMKGFLFSESFLQGYALVFMRRSFLLKFTKRILTSRSRTRTALANAVVEAFFSFNISFCMPEFKERFRAVRNLNAVLLLDERRYV